MVPNICGKASKDHFWGHTKKRSEKVSRHLFGQVCKNFGKNLLHPQKFACSYIHGVKPGTQILTFNQPKSIVYYGVFLSLFLFRWVPKRGAFMAKGRHSRGRHRRFGCPKLSPLDLPLLKRQFSTMKITTHFSCCAQNLTPLFKHWYSICNIWKYFVI